MSKEHDKETLDTEAILMTLDQIDQTIDIMNNMVGRLRNHIARQHHEIPETEATEKTPVPLPPISTDIH